MAKQYPNPTDAHDYQQHLDKDLFQQQVEASYTKLYEYLNEQLKAITTPPNMMFWTQDSWSVDSYKGTNAYTNLKAETAQQYKRFMLTYCFNHTKIQQLRVVGDANQRKVDGQPVGNIVMIDNLEDDLWTITTVANIKTDKATTEQKSRFKLYNPALHQLSLSIDAMVDEMVDEALEAVKGEMNKKEHQDAVFRLRFIAPSITTTLYTIEIGAIIGASEMLRINEELYNTVNIYNTGMVAGAATLIVCASFGIIFSWPCIAIDPITPYITRVRHDAINSSLNKSEYKTQCTVWQKEKEPTTRTATVNFEKLTADMDSDITIGLKIGLLREIFLADQKNLQRQAALQAQ